ncbi:MAG: ATP-binding protein [Candidatus Thermoplasmatota archaeon]|nr:ATP-binding protein [Candidatus Thermoplasmatota archaeon]
MEARTSVIQKRVEHIQHIICIASGKGGVGKSMVASHLALLLSKKGQKVGLLDLDLYGPSTHVILGIKPDSFPEEHHGIIPPVVQGINFMSVVYFTRDKPGAFRGEDISNIILELLAITQWGELDYLIIDLPPGIGDEILDVIHLLPQSRFIVVTTPSKVALRAVEKLLRILKEVEVTLLGVIENMSHKKDHMVTDFCTREAVEYLGRIEFDDSLEDAIGLPDKLQKIPLHESMKKINEKLVFSSLKYHKDQT